jgi:excisionase family DNA binding protein
MEETLALTTAQAAALVNVPIQVVSEAVSSGELPALQIGALTRISRRHFDAWLARLELRAEERCRHLATRHEAPARLVAPN